MEKEKEIPVITGELLAKEFKEHSVAEFFKKNRQMLGLYGKVRTLTTIIHEYITNSLDACEESRILPEIEVKIDELGTEYYQVTVKDNGPGLTKDIVGRALGQLLAGTKFHRLMQMRGQQGIGASGCTMLSQITTGQGIKVISGTGKGKAFACEITIDPKKNEPKIANMRNLERSFRGLMIQAKFKNVLYRESSMGALEYVRRSAIANPHAKIIFKTPKGERITFNRTSTHIPKPSKPMKPHPGGVTVDDVISLAHYSKAQRVMSFLKTDFERIGDHAIKEIKKSVSFDLNIDPKKLSWSDAEQIVNAFKKIKFMAPSAEGLRPIGENRIQKSLESIVEPEYVYTLTRPPKVYAGGYPFQIEIGIAYGGNAGIGSENNEEEETGKVEIMRFANRSPLLFDTGNCAITKAVHSLDWKRYGVRDLENVPLTVFANFVSVHVPYTGAGKQAITDEEEVMEELRLALMQCARKTAHYINAKRKEKESKMRRDMFYKYIPEIAQALNRVTGSDKKMLVDKLEHLVLTKLNLEKPDIEKEKILAKKKEKEKMRKEFKQKLLGE